MHERARLRSSNPHSGNPKSTIQKRPRRPKWLGLSVIAFVLVLAGAVVEAQQPKVYRVGVLLPGEPWYETIDGLRVGLRQLGLQEGKQ